MKLRKTGKRTKSVATYCVICHSEDQKVREARRYDLKLVYNRAYKKKNRAKVNHWERKWYAKRKKKKDWTVDVQQVDWHGTKTEDGFSQMTYTPLYVHGGW